MKCEDVRREYLKDDLLIFSRYTSRKIVPIIAYKYIMPNKNYVFVGVLNKDKTKVKNILTGEIHEFKSSVCCGIKDIPYVRIGLNRYAEFTINELIKQSYMVLAEDSFPYDIYKDLDALSVFEEKNKTVCFKKIKQFVKDVNNEIHKTYKQLMFEGEIEYNQNKKIKNSALTNSERDF